jgi:hypothetical protein
MQLFIACFTCIYALFMVCFMHTCMNTIKKLQVHVVQKLFSNTFSYFDSSCIITSGKLRNNINSTWNTQCQPQLYHTLPLQAQYKIMIMYICDFSYLLPREGWSPPPPSTQINNHLIKWKFWPTMTGHQLMYYGNCTQMQELKAVQLHNIIAQSLKKKKQLVIVLSRKKGRW